MNEMRYVTSGDNFLGIKDRIYQPVMSMFSWTIIIQFFPKSGRFPPPDLMLVRVIIELWYLIDLCIEFFILHLYKTLYYFYETLFPYQMQVGTPASSTGGCMGGGCGMAKESIHCSMIQTILPFSSWND